MKINFKRLIAGILLGLMYEKTQHAVNLLVVPKIKDCTSTGSFEKWRLIWWNFER